MFEDSNSLLLAKASRNLDLQPVSLFSLKDLNTFTLRNSLPDCQIPGDLADAPGVIRYLQGNAKGVEAEKQLVLQLRHKDSFIYEKPGSTPASSTGAFRGELIMRTFAFYLTWALDAPTVEEKLPAGALALATTAVYRALDVCKNGIPPSDQKTTPAPTRPGRNTLDSFNEDWAPSCQRFYDLIIKMKDDKWDLIFSASEGYILDLPNAGAGPALKRIRAESATQTRGQGNLGGGVTAAMAEDEGETIVLSD
ncbi:hypothetical protein BT96DRAFT_1003946 [Gymnopus androsaceus JB14]|uniref:Uncharacterized protein n=1 Tax=Gymnopus androsaceus JB14 TaxID=1447944 RepID=A0A6A4GSN9_9AGAR|nr:hypothetical protein BT96DRAFT_1003946 [Gymnopus androsaceus JB14]